MQYGFALLESGMCRKNNTTATYTKNILDATLGSMVAVAFGYQLAYGESPTNCSTGSKLEVEKATRVCAAFFHHLVFQATAATIVSGAMAERTTISAYSILSAFISGIPFSLAVRWTWGGGWLSSLGFHDFAGGAVVHVVGGAAAIAGVVVVGPRSGRYDPRRFYEFMPHDVSSVMSGSLVLWVGWYGFNMGSVSSLESIHSAHAAANSAVTTTISGSMGALTAVLLALARSAAIGGRKRSVDAVSLANGLLSGLVAITAASDVATVFGATLIGMGSAGSYMFVSALSEAFYLDDVVEAGAVHAGCGAWSVVAAGLLHPDKGLLYSGRWDFLFVQIMGVAAIGLVAFFTTYLVALALHQAEMLRVSEEEEAKGLDHKFGIAASSFHYHRAERIRECATVIESTGGTISELIEALQGIKSYIILPFNPHASDMVLDGQVTDVLSRMDIGFHSQSVAGKPEPNGIKRRGDTNASPLRSRIASAASLAGSKVVHGRGAKEHSPNSSPSGSLHAGSLLERKLSRAISSYRPEESSDAPAPAPAQAVCVSIPASAPPARVNGAVDDSSLQPPAALPVVAATQNGAERQVTLTPRAPTPKRPIKWLAFLSHHKQDGGDAARVFVDTARRIFRDTGETGTDGIGLMSSISASLREELIFLDSSNLSDLRKLLDHVEESANYILMLTRSALERPWVLAELVRAHRHGKRMLVISVTWPGDESSPQGRGFKFPSHLDEAIDEWQEYYYESSLRSRAMSEASERESRFAKLLAGSVLFQRLKARVIEMLRNQQERPSNASTWLPERWEIVEKALKDSTSTFSRAINSMNFKPLSENEA